MLAGQYESWILPLAVILGVPLALLGTVGALTALGAANNLYTQIGLILLIALGSKNAILVVEYARQRRAEGMEIVAAAVEGARLRFRPILMTSFAFILGVFPLVIATGAGAGARRSIGLPVFSGMIASTCLVIVFVPSFYVVMQRIQERWTRRAARNEAQPARGDSDFFSVRLWKRQSFCTAAILRRRCPLRACAVSKAALSSGCKSHPANAPAGSSRSSYGGDEIAEAFGMRVTKYGDSASVQAVTRVNAEQTLYGAFFVNADFVWCSPVILSGN